MKRIVSLLTVCFIYLLLTVPCMASGFVNPAVVDSAEYLDETQLAELTEKLDEIRQKYNFDVAVATEYEMTSYDAQSSADDIYDYCGYGSGENADGIMLYICSSTREYHITTHADGIRIFNKNGIEYLKKNIEPLLAEDNYYLAMDTFADLADELLKMAENGEVFNKKQYDMKYLMFVIGCIVFLPLIIAWIMMNGKLSKMKTAVENDYAANYIKPGSKQLKMSRDIFLYSHITKTEKAKNNSGTHKSSSGRTHGGGGGSF